MNPLERTIPLFAVSLVCACFAFSPTSQAVSPTPDGAYPGANTAEGGAGALGSLTTGTNNTALGSQALFSLTTGSQNTATGAQALKVNTADRNTADGFQALNKNTIGTRNTASGWRSLFLNTEGDDNTGVGYLALAANISGRENVAVGKDALSNGNKTGTANTAVGAFALKFATGGGNTALGDGAGVNLKTGDNNTYIDSFGEPAESGTIRIGDSFSVRTFITGISGVAVSGAGVVVNAEGQLGVAASSARFKKDIKPMDKASEAILGLKPVSFQYKKEIDPAGTSQFGLVAEEVEKVNPDLVAHDKHGKPFTVRYEAVNAMLLNEFLKEHRTVQQQQNEIDALKAELKEQKALIQKVSDKVELNRPAPQMAVNNQ